MTQQIFNSLAANVTHNILINNTLIKLNELLDVK